MIDLKLLEKEKEIEITGMIKKVSNPYVIIKSARFECLNCGALLSVIQMEEKFKEPSRCSCGWKGSFKVISRELSDQQDFIMNIFGSKEEIKVYLPTKELIEKFSNKRGSGLKIKGIVRDEYKKKSTKGVLVIYANEVDTIK